MAVLTLRGAIVAITLAACLSVCPPVQGAQQTLESDVKAAFLYNFTKFVDWPPAAFPNPSDSFRLCVIADAGFVRRLDEILHGETARGRPLQRVIPSASDITSCHLLFISRSEAARAARLLPIVAAAPVLTVGDAPDFLARGGAIAFVLEDNRVRFDVNLAATNRAGLSVDAKLLRVARRVQEAQP